MRCHMQLYNNSHGFRFKNGTGLCFACGKATPMEISSEQKLRGLQLDERENLISPVGAKEWPSDVDGVAS
ncbi:hypothetical protein RHGRI_015717 [Rhododendron griersonianum]|uniref:Uncharacterized protein n=1 Tax=Rhododendron griersonianum TaxID=479676 RepID=A0AAV6JR79_9ERIC|nr:hypothetical protein RHGRI_015717 [Rhododendron griersonianum]